MNYDHSRTTKVSISNASSLNPSRDCLFGSDNYDDDNTPEKHAHCQRLEDVGTSMINTIRDSQQDQAKCMGQLVLNVDFAPPNDDNPFALIASEHLELSRHLIEASLCMKQGVSDQQQLQTPNENNNNSNENINNDNKLESNENWRQLVEHQNSDDNNRHKRRLVYERIDKLSLYVGRRMVAGLSAGGAYQATILPFMNGTLDACFCFNLLNIRVTSAHLMRTEPACCETEELERDWLRMEQLTVELRVALLRELSRVTRSKGKIMVTVFAYECQQRNKLNRDKRRRYHFSSKRAMSEQADSGPKTHDDDEEGDSCCPRCRLEWIERRRLERRRWSAVRNEEPKELEPPVPKDNRRDSRLANVHLSSGSTSGDMGRGGENKVIECEHPARAPSGLWRALSQSGSLGDDFLGSNLQFQMHRDSISQAAKRLGRRLSQGGTSILERLLSVVGQPQPTKEEEEKEEVPVCVIEIDKESEEPMATMSEFSIDRKSDQPPYQTSEPLGQLGQFQSDDYAKRHRQSIAVQTFFTKSIEVHAEDEEDDQEIGGITPGDRQLGLDAQAERPEPGRKRAGGQMEVLASYELDELEEDSSTSGWTAPTTTGLESLSELNADQVKESVTADRSEKRVTRYSPARDEEWPSGPNHHQFSNDHHRHDDQSGDKAKCDYPSGNPLSGFSEGLASSGTNVTADRWLANQLEEAGKRAGAGPPYNDIAKCRPEPQAAIEQLSSAGGRRATIGGQQPARDELNRINSDFSSFTLITTNSTANNNTSQSSTSSGNKPQPSLCTYLDLLRAAESGQQGQRDQLLRQQQRRAHSETEAYMAGISLQTSSLDLNQRFLSKTTTNRLLSNLLGYPAGKPVGLASGLQMGGSARQIRASEPSAQDSPVMIESHFRPVQERAEQARLSNGQRAPLRGSTTTTAPTTNSDNQQLPDSMTNLIGTKPTIGRHSYQPLVDQQTSACENPSKEIASATAAQQSQQWAHSNTFSSSLNSDISTSGQKDTTEKDSSRRTSTLSGISSIYQQEISLGLNTPYSYTGSTPANSQAICSNMGSIPELAADERQILQQRPLEQPLLPFGLALAGNNHDNLPPDVCSARSSTRFSEPMRVTNEPMGLVESAGHVGNTSTTQNRCLQQEPEEQAIEEPELELNAATNLQKVAKSLRSQLRDRLSASMRPLNALIGLSVSPTDQSLEPEEGVKAGEVNSMQEQANINNHSSPLPGQSRLPTTGKLGETPTPTNLKSFFRSTSSAAFQAFASSFQHQSSSSIATPPTVKPQNLSSGSQQLISGSISSGEVFELNAQANITSSSPTMQAGFISPKFGLFGGQQQPTDPTSTGHRSSVSPISTLTSTRFLARIRDKFSLSPPIAGPSRTVSLISSSTSSTSPNTLASHQESGIEPEAAETSLGTKVTIPSQPEPFPSGISVPRDSSQVDLSADKAPDSQPKALEPENDTSSLTDTNDNGLLTSSSNSDNRKRQNSSGSNKNSNNNYSNISESDKLTEDSISSKNTRQFVVRGSRQLLAMRNLADSYDDYDQVVSSRRPSFQRQLDDQVNQVYRMAVDKKLQNIPLVNDNYLEVVADGNNKRLAHESGNIYMGPSSNLDSIVQPFGNISAPNYTSTHSIYLPSHYGTDTRGAPTDQVTSSCDRQRQWMESSQQSVDSSSSARSLRSCWFSMPELYAIHCGDSSSQSPSGAGLTNVEPNRSADMNQLLGALSSEFKMAALNEQPVGQQVDWPSNQLYRQTMNKEGQNWTLSDLNLTNDDIAAPNLLAPLAVQPSKASENEQAKQSAQQLLKSSTLDDSVCASIKSSSLRGDQQKPLDSDSTNKPDEQNNSRPTSQNSTISNTSCALSDFNSDQRDRSPSSQARSASDRSSTSMSPMNEQSVPKCAAISKQSDAKEGQSVMPIVRTTNVQSLTRQRSQSLISVDGAFEHPAQSAFLSSVSPIDTGHLRVNPATAPRRRSAMGNLMPGQDVAPAATTLDLRLAARKNRVKLTDLHPITFMNDRKFLNSMQSLKKASDNKLDAIFNSPVGRRLSVNAEVAKHSPFNQSGKSGIKIGLTGYVYIDRPEFDSRLAGNLRRPSLAPNFWRPNSNQSDDFGAPDSNGELGTYLTVEGVQPRARPRAASFTPSSLARDPIPMSTEATREPTKRYQTDKRRASMALLERLSESSVELEGVSPGPRASSVPGLRDHDRRLSLHSVSPLLRIGEDEELEPAPNLSSVDRTSSKSLVDEKVNKLTSGTSASSEGDEQGAQLHHGDPRQDNDEHSSDSSSGSCSRCSSSSSSSSSDSSDDGDIDKLVSQYPTIDYTPVPAMKHGQYLLGEQHRHQQANSDRVVKNDMILRQLLLATNAASLTATARGRLGPKRNEMRRFSAINLYQRDEDMFVANSMRRKPSTQFQVLNSLPLLAGTLPVLSPPNGSQTISGAKINQLPVLSGSKTPVKSIITGQSGLNISSYNSPGRIHTSGRVTRASSVSSALVAGVDVEEQLNRLRQQERHSQAFGMCSGASTKPLSQPLPLRCSIGGPEEILAESDPLANLTIPSTFSIPAILQPPPVSKISNFKSEPPQLPTKVTTGTEQNAIRDADSSPKETSPKGASPARSPPHSPSQLLSFSTGIMGSVSPSSPPGALLLPSSRADSLNYGSGSKSCETFKQLDTIIEGRGLLLPGADPVYSSRMRRLSGHSRRSSLSNGSQQAVREQMDADEWCKCDLSPKRKLSTAVRLTKSEHLTKQRPTLDKVAKELQDPPLRPSSISSSSKFVLDTVKSLARRTLNNLATMSGPKDLKRAPSPKTRQLRSHSMIVSSTQKTSTGGQPMLPSLLLREKVRADIDKGGSGDKQREEEPAQDNSSSSSPTGSADDSSLISLDDAENYRTKNKDNKMKHGRSLESSSSLSSSTSTISATLEELEQADPELHPIASIETDEQEPPKICFKCNKKIGMDETDTYENYYYSDHDEDDVEDEEEGECENYFDDSELPPGRGGEPELAENQQDRQQAGHKGARGTLSASLSTKAHRFTPTNRGHHGRRHSSTARRSVSMNSAEAEMSSSGQLTNRRKNKWHIQRNLAPKLKRQRSFSANYAPEVPMPMMPPPRRFSAAPTLNCPHRNKSSSHSSSSLHHTYSIDSSESLITVIPAGRGQEFKRASRGSLSCISGQGLDSSGSFYAQPRSPLSPRSPTRCSPSLLAPTTTGPPGAFEPSPSPATTNTVSSASCMVTILDQPLNCDSASPEPRPDHIERSPHYENYRLLEIHNPVTDKTAVLQDGELLDTKSICSSTNSEAEGENLSMIVENGTSHDSSKCEHSSLDTPANDIYSNQNAPVICETINDFCARHSREELEFLIGRVDYLTISDCYFSERSSTLCMIIEGKEKYDIRND